MKRADLVIRHHLKLRLPTRPCRTLADDMAALPVSRFGNIDPDLELFTWPDMIDQTRIADPATAFCGAFADDDMEMDDGV
ncbi:MAG: hypothetical protein ACK4UL_10050 [Novosphingobium meiothermophilum]|uniref:hypothetical protein n=1 Tax=Novosphingobium TaxID=165696 RepID=UPI000D6E807D|nr:MULTISPECIES: hypothetical protein [Novosphingobium]